jgi:hypothetical protein
MAVWKMLEDRGDLPRLSDADAEAAQQRKRAKVLGYMAYAAQRGTLTDLSRE